MNFDELKDPEFQEKLKEAKTPEDLIALAKAVGFELSDAELEAIAGGGFWDCGDACSAKDWTNYVPLSLGG